MKGVSKLLNCPSGQYTVGYELILSVLHVLTVFFLSGCRENQVHLVPEYSLWQIPTLRGVSLWWSWVDLVLKYSLWQNLLESG